MSLSRRELIGTGAGLVIAFHMPRTGRAAAMQPPKPKTDPNAFIRISPDDEESGIDTTVHRDLSYELQPV